MTAIVPARSIRGPAVSHPRSCNIDWSTRPCRSSPSGPTNRALRPSRAVTAATLAADPPRCCVTVAGVSAVGDSTSVANAMTKSPTLTNNAVPFGRLVGRIVPTRRELRARRTVSASICKALRHSTLAGRIGDFLERQS
jgi:hypothetical protein